MNTAARITPALASSWRRRLSMVSVRRSKARSNNGELPPTLAGAVAELLEGVQLGRHGRPLLGQHDAERVDLAHAGHVGCSRCGLGMTTTRWARIISVSSSGDNAVLSRRRGGASPTERRSAGSRPRPVSGPTTSTPSAAWLNRRPGTSPWRRRGGHAAATPAHRGSPCRGLRPARTRCRRRTRHRARTGPWG